MDGNHPRQPHLIIKLTEFDQLSNSCAVYWFQATKHIFRSMFYLVLLAAPGYGLIEDANFSVTKCNNDNGQPELTFTIDAQYFEDNLSWQADQVDFKMHQIF